MAGLHLNFVLLIKKIDTEKQQVILTNDCNLSYYIPFAVREPTSYRITVRQLNDTASQRQTNASLKYSRSFRWLFITLIVPIHRHSGITANEN